MKMKNKRGKNKKGQLTIFIIIAIVIVAVVVVLFWSRIKAIVSPVSEPQEYLSSCIEEPAKEALGRIMLQGGSIEPENYILYDDKKVEYLCYTNEYYKQCLMQQPLAKEHIEEEVKKEVNNKIKDCFSSLKEEMESRGYSVSAEKTDLNVEIIPKNLVIKISSNIILTKGGEKQSFEKFRITIKSNIYNLIMTSTSILNWEARYGDSDPMTYMLYYPNLKVEKYVQGDGSKIYILTDKNTKEKFYFATRSIAWPAGYGFGEKYEK